LTTTASCRADPWVTGAPCENSLYGLVDPKNPNPPADLNLLGYNAPVSAHVGGVPRDVLQVKLSSATPPPPPPPPAAPDVPPRQVTAALGVTAADRDHATIWWQPPPDQTSTHRTVEWYEVQRKPAQSSKWFTVSRLSVTARQLHDPDAMTTPTEYRVCGGNAGGMRCSEPVTPVNRVLTTPGAGSIQVERPQPSAPSHALAARPAESPAARVSDGALAARVEEKLKHDLPAIQPRVQVTASAGVVTLSGMVRAAADKAAVERAASGVQGVTRIQNNLLVSPF
jgi:BON domain